MPRRRYRLFIVLALVIVVLLYRILQNSWDAQLPKPVALGQSQRPAEAPLSNVDKPNTPGTGKSPVKVDGKKRPEVDHVTQKVDDEKTFGVAKPGTGADEEPELSASTGTHWRPNDKEIPGIDSTQQSGNEKLVDQKEGIPPKKPMSDVAPPLATPTKARWTKLKEHFPLPKESIITLPTGTAKKIPKIQHIFSPESEGPKKLRLERQAVVKTEIQRSWAGYRKHAWMHDELSPVTNRSRDPFCGWAATLVDSLDTLWIAGLKNEFDEAARAARIIDFTYTNRSAIPVFETTIRYLGGLIAAYDVSGGASGGYSFLLDKAVELAEVLMGVFDTPNRMPILFYKWRPEYTSQPRRASRAGMAELATLSLEFTRLAQATGQHKYYDAVDRITNGLIDMQRSITSIPGLFPEVLDISGCNRTATNERKYMSKALKDHVKSAGHLEVSEGHTGIQIRSNANVDNRRERRFSIPPREDSANAEFIADKGIKSKPQFPLGANGHDAEWDCVFQGIVPATNGYQKYHMSGGQDSAYEYFGKEYLLLGGKEKKYQKLYEDTVDGINKYLLFRPMIPGNWDIIFPAKVEMFETGNDEFNVQYEASHLTCFIGAMYALGGKLFGREKDLKYAEKLTNGCVWAYQSTASGIMPEAGQLVPCPTFDKCSFNETLWWQELDPLFDLRDQQVLDWEKNETERQQRGQEEAQRQKQDVVRTDGVGGTETVQREENEAFAIKHDVYPLNSSFPSSAPEETNSLEKRAILPVAPSERKLATSSASDQELDVIDYGADSSAATKENFHETKFEMPALKEDYHSHTPVRKAPGLGLGHSDWSSKPPTHKEFVQEKVDRGLPPGYSTVSSAKYILRPEAIESVWYMYRITGDPSWMEKGWTMFEATMKATRAPSANSAVFDVLSKESELLDEMESFWLAETLKYYYLLFSEPNLISLDEWVLNTEAHPFKL